MDVWNKWREENPDVEIDLSDCNLIGENLRKANFSEADLSHAGLISTSLEFGVFKNANLFTADLIGSNHSGANLNGAYLMEADLTSADLSETDLSFTEFWGVILVNNDLSRVGGLETIVHTGPSSIGIDKIQIS